MGVGGLDGGGDVGNVVRVRALCSEQQRHESRGAKAPRWCRFARELKSKRFMKIKDIHRSGGQFTGAHRLFVN